MGENPCAFENTRAPSAWRDPSSARGLIDVYYEITSLPSLLLQTLIRDAYLTHLNYVLYFEMYPGTIDADQTVATFYH